jgi:hypothetical protein
MSDVLDEERQGAKSKSAATKSSKTSVKSPVAAKEATKYKKEDAKEDISDGSVSDAEIEGDGCTVLEVGDEVMVGK